MKMSGVISSVCLGVILLLQSAGAEETAAAAASITLPPDKVAALEKALIPRLARRYLETNCTPTDWKGWEGFPTQHCDYKVFNANGDERHATVITLSPSANQLARWIIYACLEKRGIYQEADIKKLTNHIFGQSGGQFPIAGVVFEDMDGDGLKNAYSLRDGVTVQVVGLINGDTSQPTDVQIAQSLTGAISNWTGRFARIASTTREQYYGYFGSLSRDVGDENNRKTEWLTVVRELYQQAWNSDKNSLICAWAKANL